MNRVNESEKYKKQHRGGTAAYESYFAGMDSSMQQKVALTTAHFPSHGRIADMGSGSGRGTFELARLYDGLSLVGVDINPVSVEMSRNNYKQANLSYIVGDIAEKVFENETLDGILDSSVLHHVTSFNGFDVGRVMFTFDNQIAQLKTGGVLIIRDFVIPDDGEKEIYFDLPNADGLPEGEIEKLSSSALFEKFVQEFRSSVNMNTPLRYEKLSSFNSNLNRYRVTLRGATEFVLRKDYRADWATEILEEYTYLSQSDFEKAFRERGMRIVVSMPLWNPWIVQNRFAGKFSLHDLQEKPLPFPPTNYLIVGEKVNENDGVVLVEEESIEIKEPKFLKLKAYRDTTTNQVWELVERPNRTIDLLPWFEDNGQIFVLARKDYPRPIINACIEQLPLHRANVSGYITEPITAIFNEEEFGTASLTHILSERGGISEDKIVSSASVFAHYLTSPGGINELVTSCAVQIKPDEKISQPLLKTLPFTETGTIRELDAVQVLRASQVGGMFDARLEINIYRLLLSLKYSVGPWIGAALNFTEQKPEDFQHDDESIFKASDETNIFFEPCELPEERFLSVHKATFVEKNANGEILAEAEYEYVIPRTFSEHTIVTIPVIKTGEDIFIGLENRKLPAPEIFGMNAYLPCVPAWRLPKSVTHIQELDPFVKSAMKKDFNLTVNFSRELGGAYFASPGITPELVYPFAVEVDADDASNSALKWISANDLIANIDKVSDAHTIIAAYRLANATKLLGVR